MERQNHPDQRTCNECFRFAVCKANGVAHAAQAWCEWDPTRFREKGAKHGQSTEPNISKEEYKQPFCLIDEQSARIVLELVEASKKLNLGNIGFQTSKPVRAEFRAKDRRKGWELTVATGFGNSKRDVYKITKDGLDFMYSETDGDS